MEKALGRRDGAGAPFRMRLFNLTSSFARLVYQSPRDPSLGIACFAYKAHVIVSIVVDREYRWAGGNTSGSSLGQIKQARDKRACITSFWSGYGLKSLIGKEISLMKVILSSGFNPALFSPPPLVLSLRELTKALHLGTSGPMSSQDSDNASNGRASARESDFAAGFEVMARLFVLIRPGKALESAISLYLRFRLILSSLQFIEETPRRRTRNQIEKDLARSLPGHPSLEGHQNQQSLRTLLNAYAVFNPKVGELRKKNVCSG